MREIPKIQTNYTVSTETSKVVYYICSQVMTLHGVPKDRHRACSKALQPYSNQIQAIDHMQRGGLAIFYK